MDDDIQLVLMIFNIAIILMLMLFIFMFIPRISPQSIMIERDTEGRITAIHYIYLGR